MAALHKVIIKQANMYYAGLTRDLAELQEDEKRCKELEASLNGSVAQLVKKA